MGTKAYKDYVAALRKTSLLAQKEFSDLWEKLDVSQPYAVRDALLVLVPGIVYKYSPISALVAAEYYEHERIEAGGDPSFEAVLSDGIALEQIQSSVRFAAGHLFGGDEDEIQPESNGSLFSR